MSFSNFRIGTRQAMGFGFLIVLFLVMGYLGVSRLDSVMILLDDVVRDRIPKIDLAARMVDSYQTAAIAVRNTALTTDLSITRNQREMFEKKTAELKADAATLDKAITLPKARECMARIQKALSALDPLLRKALDDASANRNEEAAQVLFKEVTPIEAVLMKDLDDLSQIMIDRAKEEAAVAMEEGTNGKRFMFILALAGLIIGVGCSYLIARSVTRPLKRAVEGLSEGADQVASASAQVSSSSQELAQGASEQAASLEETSSSLEEMASMTKQNADNAAQANQLMEEARRVVDRANQSMSHVTRSMADISAASEETQKIIKTIDEIAFQTNLLALNAAVEAARAGEAGAGFAVVADEVRNLAMRAADAAKNTAGLIEGTVKRVGEGAGLVRKTNEEFSEVSSTVTRSGELVGEIAAASREQAQGIDQVNRAMSEMDKVTQKNAANAEESASASEEMNAQAAQMREFVAEIAVLVGGDEKKEQKSGGRTVVTVKQAAPRPAGKAVKALPKKAGGGKGKELAPQQVIPFDDDMDGF